MPPVAATRAGAKNWSSVELSHMLDLVEENLPLGNADWEALTLSYLAGLLNRNLNRFIEAY